MYRIQDENTQYLAGVIVQYIHICTIHTEAEISALTQIPAYIGVSPHVLAQSQEIRKEYLNLDLCKIVPIE